jgi:hypothetical protein
LPVGTYSFTVTATSGPLTHSVTGQFNVGDFSGSVSPTALTVTVGNQAASVITISSTNGLSGQVMLNCPSPPQGIGCSFSEQLPNLPANGSVMSTLTISVISKPSASVQRRAGFPRTLSAILIALLLLAVSLFVFESQQAKWRPMRIAAQSSLLFCLAAALSSCGGGGNGAGGSGGGGGSSMTVAVPVTAAFGSETKTIGTMSVTVP